jgi:hypothetical protein
VAFNVSRSSCLQNGQVFVKKSRRTIFFCFVASASACSNVPSNHSTRPWSPRGEESPMNKKTAAIVGSIVGDLENAL